MVEGRLESKSECKANILSMDYVITYHVLCNKILLFTDWNNQFASYSKICIVQFLQDSDLTEIYNKVKIIGNNYDEPHGIIK